MIVVVDASVAVKWVVDEEKYLLARSFLALDHRHIVPDLIMTEVGNALRNKVRRNELDVEQARMAMAKGACVVTEDQKLVTRFRSEDFAQSVTSLETFMLTESTVSPPSGDLRPSQQ